MMGCRQAVRHGPLEPAFGGSNPPTPAKGELRGFTVNWPPAIIPWPRPILKGIRLRILFIYIMVHCYFTRKSRQGGPYAGQKLKHRKKLLFSIGCKDSEAL